MSVFSHYPNLAEFQPLSRTESNAFNNRLPVATGGNKTPGQLNYKNGCITTTPVYNPEQYDQKVINESESNLKIENFEKVDFRPSDLFPWSPYHLANEYKFPHDRLSYPKVNLRKPMKQRYNNDKHRLVLDGYFVPIVLGIVGMSFILLSVYLLNKQSVCKLKF